MPEPAGKNRTLPVIAAIFFLSGLPALIYQIVWQRALFAIFGINIESVTVVVTAFMLGLGLGSLLGGYISKTRKIPLLILFGLIELGIGIYGLLSLNIFAAVGTVTLGASTIQTGLLALGLVILPTLLMGATLPILVNYYVGYNRNVGRAVGILYFFNTLGSAIACFAAALVLMHFLGMRGTVLVAVLANFIAATTAFVASYIQRQVSINPKAVETDHSAGTNSRIVPAMVLAGIAGFISLSYEIIWFRIFSYMSGSLAPVFALLLGSFLAGIAFGSLFARRLCVYGARNNLKTLSRLILIATMVSFSVAPITAFVSARLGNETVFIVALAGAGMLGLVAIAAALLGATFPVLCHYAIPADAKAGQGTSFLYLANIIGSATGSLATGYVLMDVFSTPMITVILGVFGLAVAVIVSWLARTEEGIRWDQSAAVAGIVIIFVSLSSMEKSFWARLQRSYQPFTHIHENRHGVIAVGEDGTIYGGGAYDGVFNTDLVDDPNWIIRPYSISAFHASPRRVLMIGLASGSWAKVVANNPVVEELTVVEINPGYLDLIRKRPLVADLLNDPKVSIIIDDGRRWLNSHPDRQFDLIVQNTTYHWRASSSNLLSVEFLKLIRKHLIDGGLFLYNTTGSDHAQRTACEVFPYVVRVYNNLYVSDSPIEPNKERWTAILDAYEMDGRPLFDLSNQEHVARREEVLSLLDTIDLPVPLEEGLESRESILARTRGLQVLTDDNMGEEWMPPMFQAAYDYISNKF